MCWRSRLWTFRSTVVQRVWIEGKLFSPFLNCCTGDKISSVGFESAYNVFVVMHFGINAV